MTTYDVTVTWMDGQQESYVAETAFVENGVLKINPPRRHEAVRFVPLTTVRIFTVNPR